MVQMRQQLSYPPRAIRAKQYKKTNHVAVTEMRIEEHITIAARRATSVAVPA
jgi:hypothetical protein